MNVFCLVAYARFVNAKIFFCDYYLVQIYCMVGITLNLGSGHRVPLATVRLDSTQHTDLCELFEGR